ncbi:MAG: hypothetical protein Q4D76_09495 [Oscillospiraceae bacterium]|nr:hypothetical protein [Oscillospiraceae bacterium]
MNQNYQEIVEQLRQQTNKNQKQLYGKVAYPYRYHSSYENIPEQTNNHFMFSCKMILFFVCVLAFSCYLYGGQDFKKGVSLAYKDIHASIQDLEENEPIVKEAMGYCKKGYHFIMDKTKQYHD